MKYQKLQNENDDLKVTHKIKSEKTRRFLQSY